MRMDYMSKFVWSQLSFYRFKIASKSPSLNGITASLISCLIKAIPDCKKGCSKVFVKADDSLYLLVIEPFINAG